VVNAGHHQQPCYLSEQQQKELDKQRALQQQKIKDIKAQLDALRQDL
jgi:hypothetical protein